MERLITCLITGLQNAGFRAEWAGPDRVMPRITGPVVAVSLPEMEFLQNPEAEELGAAAKLRVSVFSPTALGAAKCQDTAYQVAMTLSGGIQGIPPLRCRVTEAAYYGPGDYFLANVFASFAAYSTEEGYIMPDEALQLVIGTKKIGPFQLMRFDRRQTVIPVYSFGEARPPLQVIRQQCYILTLERIFPSAKWDAREWIDANDFEFQIIRGGRFRIYGRCNWLSCSWEDTAQGSKFHGEAITYHYGRIGIS